MSINRTAKTWGAELLTSSDLNAEVKNLWTGLQAAWVSYTPTWGSSGTAPAKNNGTIAGAYYQVGKTVDFHIELTIGSTSTNGTGLYNFSLPVTAAWTALSACGNAIIHNDDANANASRTVLLLNSTTVGLISDSGDRVAADSPFTPATGDKYFITGRYEAA